AEDRILQCHIRNLLCPLSPLIETYLREAGFLHVALIGQGCKLDPELISALVERWRSETHTFHIPCSECTIILEDVHLQLGLLVDGSVVTGSLAEDSIEEERERYARAYIFQIIEGMLMPNKSRNLIHLRWLLKLVNFRGASELNWGSAVLATLYREMCQATQPEKIKIVGCLLLLQSWAQYRFPTLRPQFGWTPYKDPVIRAVILEEFFVNPNAWHVKVPFVVYTTVEMHEADRVLRQFGFQQSIFVAPQKFDDLYHIDLWRPDTNWPFKIHGKPYLYEKEVRRRHPHMSRSRRGPLNLRDSEVGLSSVPT
ncbi:hypothetical protein Golax_020508, partial [Gossypium laxum]|nr:hypothetical protein [Gossypium laxum]